MEKVVKDQIEKRQEGSLSMQIQYRVVQIQSHTMMSYFSLCLIFMRDKTEWELDNVSKSTDESFSNEDTWTILKYWNLLFFKNIAFDVCEAKYFVCMLNLQIF